MGRKNNKEGKHSISGIINYLKESIVGSGGIGNNSPYKGNHNAVSSGAVYGHGAELDSKLFNQLVQWDRNTLAMIQPFMGGRFVFVPGQMPPMMENLYPEATNYMRVLFTSTIINVSGFEDNTLEVETVNALTEQNSYSVITKASGSTKQITLTFMTMFQGLPIYRYITTWMNHIQNRGSGVSSYPHLTEGSPKGALEYHEGNHSMNAIYIIPDPSMRYVEDGAFIYSMVPTSNLQSTVLEQEWGSSAPKQYAVPFKCMVITAQHWGVRNVLENALKDWVRYIALDDSQVIIDNIIPGGQL